MSFTRVETTEDLRSAKLYVSLLDESQAEDTLEALRHAAGMIRGELMHRIQARRIPELRFVHDRSIAHSVHIAEVLEQLKHEDASAGRPGGSRGGRRRGEVPVSRDRARILALLRGGGRFLVTSHVNPDGDSIASQCALRLLVERLGGRADIVNSHPVPRAYRFLPGTASFGTRPPKSWKPYRAVDRPRLRRRPPRQRAARAAAAACRS